MVVYCYVYTPLQYKHPTKWITTNYFAGFVYTKKRIIFCAKSFSSSLIDRNWTDEIVFILLLLLIHLHFRDDCLHGLTRSVHFYGRLILLWQTFKLILNLFFFSFHCYRHYTPGILWSMISGKKKFRKLSRFRFIGM